MSTTTATNSNVNADPKSTQEASSIVDAFFDAALAWADVGLQHAKTSLHGSARAMERTAKALDTVRERLKA